MKLKKLALTLTVALSTFALAACSQNTKVKNLEVSEKSEVPKDITITHEIDEVTLNVNPEKIIVFDYGVLDSLDALGEEVIGLPKSNIPTHLDKYNDEKYEDVGTLKEPNFEKIYELKPDVIFISTRQKDLYEQFKEIAPTIYVPLYGEKYLQSFKDNMNIIGKIFNKENEVKEEILKIETASNELNDQVKSSGKNALFIMADEGSMSAYGLGSRFGIIHDQFGFIPVDEKIDTSTHGQKISFEYIVEKNPDYIFIIDRGAVTSNGNLSAENLMNNDMMKKTAAFENDNIVYLDSHIWYVATGGINGTMKMIEEVKASVN